MQLLKEEFDSEIFKKDVYKINVSENLTEQDIINTTKDLHNCIVYVFTPFSNRIIELLTKYNFLFISIRNTYKLNISSYTQKKIELEEGYKLFSYQENKSIITPAVIDHFANTMKKGRRYEKDRRFNQDDVTSLYKKWLENSFFNNYVQEIFLVTYNDTICGFISIKTKDNSAYIDLLAVDEKYRGKKLGSNLLKKALSWIIDKGVKDIYLVTEGENIPANALYQRYNFVISNIDLVFHRHIL